MGLRFQASGIKIPGYGPRVETLRYNMHRAYGTTRFMFTCSPVGMTHFVARDFNPWGCIYFVTTGFNPLFVIDRIKKYAVTKY